MLTNDVPPRPLRKYSATIDFPGESVGPQLHEPIPVSPKHIRARRESCLVHNLLQPKLEGATLSGPVAINTIPKGLATKGEIRSLMTTPVQKLTEMTMDDDDDTPLDSDRLSDLVVSVRDLSKSLSKFSISTLWRVNKGSELFDEIENA